MIEGPVENDVGEEAGRLGDRVCAGVEQVGLHGRDHSRSLANERRFTRLVAVCVESYRRVVLTTGTSTGVRIFHASPKRASVRMTQ